MKKSTFNLFKKWQYSRMIRDVNVLCDEQPPKSEAHFVALYALMLCAGAGNLTKESFQTLLYTINRNTALNYSIFEIFRLGDNYAREQIALRFSDFYSELCSIKEGDKEGHIRLRNKIAQNYAEALGCHLGFVDLEEAKGASIFKKFSEVDSSLKTIISITMQEHMGQAESSSIIQFIAKTGSDG